MQFSLATKLDNLIKEITIIDSGKGSLEAVLPVIEKFPAQIVLLCLQVMWCNRIEKTFNETNGEKLGEVEEYIMKFLATLAENVIKNLPKEIRQKYEQIITDFVH